MSTEPARSLDRPIHKGELESLPDGTVIYSDKDIFLMKQDDGTWDAYSFHYSSEISHVRGAIIGHVVSWAIKEDDTQKDDDDN